MTIRRQPSKQKTIETILYIAQCTNDLYKIGKIIYFADKKHLERYGRFMFGDKYTRLEHGPVPSLAYGILRYTRGERDLFTVEADTSNAFRVEQRQVVVPLRTPDKSWLSQSEMECLDESIKENAQLTMSQLKAKSEDAACMVTPENKDIPLIEIAKTLSNSELLIDYLMNH